MVDVVNPDVSDSLSGPVPDGEQLLGREYLLALAVSAFVIEFAVLAELIRGAMSFTSASAIHIAVCTVLWGYAIFNLVRDRWRRGDLLLALTITTTGLFGAVGCLYAFVLHKHYSRKTRSFQEWYESLFPDEVRDEAMELFEDIESGRDSLASANSVESFGDILAYGSFEQKLAVLALVSRHFRPEFAAPLKQALEDDAPAIRVRAATAMADIENAYLSRSLELTKELEESPDDFDANHAMAVFLDDYVFSGILDDVTKEENRKAAFDYYRRCHEIDPSHDGVHLAIARILLREGNHEGVVSWLKEAREQGLNDPRADDWFMESLYALRDYDGLREAAANHYSQDPANTLPTRRTGEIAALWAANDEPEKTGGIAVESEPES